MSNTDNTAKGNVKICNRNHNHGDDWDDGGCCQDAKATDDNHINDEIIVSGAKNQQKKPQ